MTQERMKQYRETVKKLTLRDRSKISGLVHERFTIINVIEKIPDIRYQGVLELYYLEGLSWQEVADCMFYSLRWVFKLHRAALEQLRKEDVNGTET